MVRTCMVCLLLLAVHYTVVVTSQKDIYKYYFRHVTLCTSGYIVWSCLERFVMCCILSVCLSVCIRHLHRPVFSAGPSSVGSGPVCLPVAILAKIKPYTSSLGLSPSQPRQLKTYITTISVWLA